MHPSALASLHDETAFAKSLQRGLCGVVVGIQRFDRSGYGDFSFARK